MRTATDILKHVYKVADCTDERDARIAIENLMLALGGEPMTDYPAVLRRYIGLKKLVEKFTAKVEQPNPEDENQNEPAPKMSQREIKEYEAIKDYAAKNAPKKSDIVTTVETIQPAPITVSALGLLEPVEVPAPGYFHTNVLRNKQKIGEVEGVAGNGFWFTDWLNCGSKVYTTSDEAVDALVAKHRAEFPNPVQPTRQSTKLAPEDIAVDKLVYILVQHREGKIWSYGSAAAMLGDPDNPLVLERDQLNYKARGGFPIDFEGMTIYRTELRRKAKPSTDN